MKPLIQPAEAQTHIRAHLTSFPPVDCPIDQCAGRVLREDVIADRPLPPFDRAMMDGYALRVDAIAHVDLFKITDEAPAGAPAKALAPEIGSCIEIMTGAVLPTGADCVVPYEETEPAGKNRIRLIRPMEVAAGAAIHRAGSDHSTGEALIRAGRVIGSREVAIAATCGYAMLRVSRRPRITIVSTGDELVPVSESPQPHQIRRSNDLMLETALLRAGYPAGQRRHLPDEPENATAALTTLLAENDIVLVSGGISMGKKDFIPAALDANGLVCHFHGVAQKPGKPMGFWSRPDAAVFALPGNPLSTLACLHHYILPALRHASGGAGHLPQRVTLAAPAKGHPNRTVFSPVSLDADHRATPRAVQNSGDLVSILESDGYVELPPSEGAHPADSAFAFHPWL